MTEVDDFNATERCIDAVQAALRAPGEANDPRIAFMGGAALTGFVLESRRTVAVEKTTDFVYVECAEGSPVKITRVLPRENLCYILADGVLWAPTDGGQMVVFNCGVTDRHFRLEGQEMVDVPGLPANSTMPVSNVPAAGCADWP